MRRKSINNPDLFAVCHSLGQILRIEIFICGPLRAREIVRGINIRLAEAQTPDEWMMIREKYQKLSGVGITTFVGGTPGTATDRGEVHGDRFQ